MIRSAAPTLDGGRLSLRLAGGPVPSGHAPSSTPTLVVDAVDELYPLIDELYPVMRSLTGEGNRATLRRLGDFVALESTEVPTGTDVLDWTVPREWEVNGAWIADASGNRIVDVADHGLHLLGYSEPFDGTLCGAELRDHLFSLPAQPEAIPYRTSYWAPRWGFCVRQGVVDALQDDERYRVMVDTEFVDGALSYGEAFLPGTTTDEFLLSAHICHPWLANDNLSGNIAALAVWRILEQTGPHRCSFRLLLSPGTLGPIAWLAANRDGAAARIRHGLVMTNVGDHHALTYKRSERGTSTIDRAAGYVLANWPRPGAEIEFSPYGYDERQFCSPGFGLAVGRLSRGIHGTFPKYHTSLDDPSFVTPAAIADAVHAVLSIIAMVDEDETLRNLAPFGEPQLGRRGLYRSLSGMEPDPNREMAILWVLNQSNGTRSLSEIARRSGIAWASIRRAADALVGVDLLGPAAQTP